MRSEFEARLIRAEQLAIRYQLRTARLAEKVGRLGQSIFALVPGNYSDAGGPPAPNTSFSGSNLGCAGAGVSGTAVTITRDSDSAVLWTGMTDGSGNYSDSIYLASNTAVHVSGVPTSARFATYNVGTTLVVGGSNTLGPGALTSAAGYQCVSLCNEPLSRTLKVTNTSGGSLIATMTYPSSPLPFHWKGTSSGGTLIWELTVGGVFTLNGVGRSLTGTTCPPSAVSLVYGAQTITE